MMNRKPQKDTGEIEEDADYYRAVCSEDEKVTSDKKFGSFTQSFLPLAVSWVILLVILSLHIYFISVISETNAELTAQNQELETQNQELSETIQEESELNSSGAQWSLDTFCKKQKTHGRCRPCELGWESSQSSCYEVNDGAPDDGRTWAEARADCNRKTSDLVVVVNEEEKTFVNRNSSAQHGVKGYWIGLRAEDGKWKWVNGSELTENSWIQQQHPTDGHCVISVPNQGWTSVKCGNKNAWICKKKALSVLPWDHCCC